MSGHDPVAAPRGMFNGCVMTLALWLLVLVALALCRRWLA